MSERWDKIKQDLLKSASEQDEEKLHAETEAWVSYIERLENTVEDRQKIYVEQYNMTKKLGADCIDWGKKYLELHRQKAILEKAFRLAIDELSLPDLFCDNYVFGTDSLHEGKNYHEEFTCEKDDSCDPEDCFLEKQTNCIYKHFIAKAESELKTDQSKLLL